MRGSDLITKMVEQLINHKTIGGDGDKFRDKLTFFCKIFLAAIIYAALRGDATENVISGKDLTKFIVDRRFSPIILPCQVGVVPSRGALNLVDYDFGDIEKEFGQMPSKREFDEAQDFILSLFKSEVNESSNLFEMSGFLSLTDVFSKCYSGEECHYNDTSYFPIKIKCDLMKDTYYNVSVGEMIEEVLLDLSRSLRN